MEQRHIPRPGEFYKHFKGNLYQIITVAKDSETEEKMVVYQALYKTFEIYVRSLEQFMSEVERDKYPLAEQKFRFEQTEADDMIAPLNSSYEEPTDKHQPNAVIMSFLECDSYKEKLDILYSIKNEKTDSILDTMAVSLDLQLNSKDVDEKWDDIRKHLETLYKYDGRRLR